MKLPFSISQQADILVALELLKRQQGKNANAARLAEIGLLSDQIENAELVGPDPTAMVPLVRVAPRREIADSSRQCGASKNFRVKYTG